MSRIIATFIDKPEHHVANIINKLEQKAGYSSEDVRLLAESAHLVRNKVSQLGLDPDDTTGEELYHALLARFERDSSVIDRSLGVTVDSAVDKKVTKAISFIEHAEGVGEIWAVKKSKVKKILSELGLPKTIRQLNYRSLDSLLKHEDAFEVAVGAFGIESPTWRKNFNSKVAKLSTADYELRPISTVVLGSSKWGNLATSSSVSQTLGAVTISESSLSNKASVLAIALMVHDQMAKLSTKKFTKKLSILNPVLHWWEEAEHLMSWNDGEPISLNYKDIAYSHINAHSYEQRTKSKATEAFWNQLVSRYKAKIQDIPAELAEAEQKAEQKTAELVAPGRQFAEEMETIDNNGSR